MTLVAVVGTLSQYSTLCCTRQHRVDLESICKQTKLYQVSCDVLPQMWKRICE